MLIEKKPAICGICPGACAVEVTLESGRLVKVEPRRGVPYANLCVRGRYAPEIVYSPHRLKTPLIRTGERGEGDSEQLPGMKHWTWRCNQRSAGAGFNQVTTLKTSTTNHPGIYCPGHEGFNLGYAIYRVEGVF